MFADVDFSQGIPITYTEAKRRRPKTEKVYLDTPVLWEEKLEKQATQKIKLHCLSDEIDIIVPKVINDKLPTGYHMDFHPSWLELRKKIYDPYKNQYSFEQLELICLDNKLLSGLDINLDIPNDEYSAYMDEEGGQETIKHEEFWKWRYRYAEAWDKCVDEIHLFFKSHIEFAISSMQAKNDPDNPPQEPPPESSEIIREILDSLNNNWETL